jgi:hypothetical protein
MSWNSLAGNQMVSYTDSQGGPFSLNPGRGYINDNQCMTKDAALYMYSLEAGYMSAFASNQLVPKDYWVAAQITYNYYGYFYGQDPCGPMLAVYYGSNGQWYYDAGGTYYPVYYACNYAYYDDFYMAYVYNMYYFEPANPYPIYWGDTTSQCAPF